MKHLLIAGMSLLAVATETIAADAPAVPSAVRDELNATGSARVIVELPVPEAGGAEDSKDEASRSVRRAAIASRQAAVLARLKFTNSRVVRPFESIPFAALQVDEAGLAELLRSGDVVDVAEDRVNELFLSGSVPRVEAQPAVLGAIDGSGWAVAVLDTGVERTHPFMGGRVVEEACYSVLRNCPNGQTTQLGAGAGAPCTYSSSCYHGTHVAGIAAGAAAGQAPGVARAADIIAIQVFSNVGGGPGAYDSDLIAALERVYALRTTRQIAAVNMSLGGGRYSSQAQCDSANAAQKSIIDNLRAAGIATIIAAGNSGYTNSLGAPGCISSAISVGCTTKAGGICSFSNSAPFLTLWAPGASIRSSVLGGLYASASGTSMSAPHVAGAWAVLRDGSPGSSVNQVLNAIRTTGLPTTDGRNGVNVPDIRVRPALLALVGYCGDGVIQNGEQCDNGGANSDSNPNACRTNCRNAYCGDDVVDSGEQCDDGAGNSNTVPGACRTDCTPARCGDRVVDPGETCDDGGTASGDCCSAACQTDPNGTSCEDGAFCNGSNVCNAGVCAPGTPPCSGTPCDVCIEELDGCGCSFTAGDTFDGVEPILDGVCGDGSPGGAFCSLRGAIQEANARPGPDLVMLPLRRYQLFRSSGGACNSADGDIDITDDVAIRGVTEATVDARQIDRAFRVHPGVHAAMDRMGIENGLPNQVVCGENDPCTGNTVIACVLAGDDSDTVGAAGVAHYLGPFAFGSWSNPQCGTSGSGWHSPLGTCGAGSGAGNKRCRSVLAVSNACPATAGKGGAVYSEGILDLTNVGFSNNNAAGNGGAIAVEGVNSALRIVGAQMQSNRTPGSGGLISFDVRGSGGELRLANFVATGNRSFSKLSGSGGGALYVASSAAGIRIENSTFADNAAYANAGAFYFVNVGDASNACVPEQDVILNNVTVHGNRSDDDGSGQGEGGGLYHDHLCTCGGGCPAPLDIELYNSIFGGNSGGGTGDCFMGYPYPLGGAYNAMQNPGVCSLGSMTSGTVIVGADPLVQLGYWGGPRLASRLLPGSPALAAGSPAAPGSDPTACLRTDSLGVSRPQGPTGQVRCDLGAMEDPTGLTRVPPCRGFLCGRITPRAGVALQFSEVAQEGELSAQVAAGAAPLPADFDVGASATPFVEIASDALVQGSTEVCLSYDATDMPVESRAEILRFENGAWVSLPVTSRNFVTNEVCADLSASLEPELLTIPQELEASTLVLGSRSVCTTAPRSSCEPAEPRKSTLQLRAGGAEEKASFKWKWKQAVGGLLTQFDDPSTSSRYAVCLYDESSETPRLLYSAEAPLGGTCAGKPCWRSKGSPPGAKGHQYGDKELTPDGLQKIQLKPGADGKAQLSVQGRGARLSLPPIPLNPPLRAQLQAANGGCWDATFSAAGIRSNAPGSFRASND